jgi:hypothetical protein
MGPLIVATAIAGGIAQYINGEKARKQSAATLSKIQNIYDKMSVPQYDESGIPQPGFDVSKLTPEDYKVLQQYIPEVAQQVKEVAPQVVSETSDMKTGRQAQLDALNKLRGIASGAPDPQFQEKMRQANQNASIAAQSKIDSVLQEQARRGLLGSGNQMAAQLQGASSNMANAAQSSSDAAIESYRNQLQALRDSATLGGQVRSSDQSMQAQNADIINAYNARTAQAGQNWANQQANTLNQAQQYNLSQAQQAANQNTQQANQYNMYNQQYGNQMAQQSYANQLAQQQYANTLKQNQFADQMNINSGLSGAFQGMAANTMQGAADKNAAIGGLTSGLTAAAMYQGLMDRKNANAGTTAAPSPSATSDNSKASDFLPLIPNYDQKDTEYAYG